MDILTGFRDPAIAKNLVERIRRAAVRPMKLMEVCGTHTVAIARNGLRDLMPENVTLLSGPGCPVCVTANRDIDLSLAVAQRPEVILTTFGDMMKVPGSRSSLAKEKAAGADIRIVYSALDALDLAEKNPEREVVFLGVGFETTAPTIAAAILSAEKRGLENFTVLAMHKTVPAALGALADDPDVKVNGFILPGHVSAIIGLEPYRFLAEKLGIPSVITGFEPVDVLQGVLMLVEQLRDGRAEAEIAYTRSVLAEGNPAAVAMMEKVFEPTDAEWRGIGVIPGTGLGIRGAYAKYDAARRIEVEVPEPREIPGCQCGEVLRGITLPFECKLFGRGCTPEHPIGPCMVSSEGSCAAYYRYTDYGKSA